MKQWRELHVKVFCYIDRFFVNHSSSLPGTQFTDFFMVYYGMHVYDCYSLLISRFLVSFSVQLLSKFNYFISFTDFLLHGIKTPIWFSYCTEILWHYSMTYRTSCFIQKGVELFQWLPWVLTVRTKKIYFFVTLGKQT